MPGGAGRPETVGPAGRREGGDDTTDDTAGIKLITGQESESYSWPRYDGGGGADQATQAAGESLQYKSIFQRK